VAALDMLTGKLLLAADGADGPAAGSTVLAQTPV
jgi:hypothetical protein